MVKWRSGGVGKLGSGEVEELGSGGVGKLRSGEVEKYWGKKWWSWGVIYFVMQRIDLHLQEVRRETLGDF